MNFDMHRIRATLGLAAKAAAAMCLTVGVMPAAHAQGTAKDAAGATMCTFTSFSYNAATNTLSLVGCTVGGGQPTQGTFTWQSSTASTTPGGAYAIVRVNRNGNLDKAYNVSYTVSGGPTLAANWWFNGTQSGGTIPFAPNVGSVDLAFYPGSLAGTATITLTGATPTDGGGVMTASGTVTVTVGSPPPPQQPNGVTKAGCATSAAKGSPFTVNSQKIEVTLVPGETAAFAFTPRNDTTELSSTETINTPDTAEHDVFISPCPGDFTPRPNCSYHATSKGSNIGTSISPNTPWAKCIITSPNETWFMNVRQVRPDGQNSCTFTAGCDVRVQIQGY